MLQHQPPNRAAIETLNKCGHNFYVFCMQRAERLNNYNWLDPITESQLTLTEYQLGPWRVTFDFEDNQLISWGYERKGKGNL